MPAPILVNLNRIPLVVSLEAQILTVTHNSKVEAYLEVRTQVEQLIKLLILEVFLEAPTIILNRIVEVCLVVQIRLEQALKAVVDCLVARIRMQTRLPPVGGYSADQTLDLALVDFLGERHRNQRLAFLGGTTLTQEHRAKTQNRKGDRYALRPILHEQVVFGFQARILSIFEPNMHTEFNYIHVSSCINAYLDSKLVPVNQNSTKS
mmetsp:Transcript_4050/g.4967  ORF Transcript_4050/g.4967 Transcript_4050/m.4967 type:complete len:207 (-) Transcript_4050:2-622(-)